MQEFVFHSKTHQVYGFIRIIYFTLAVEVQKFDYMDVTKDFVCNFILVVHHCMETFCEEL